VLLVGGGLDVPKEPAKPEIIHMCQNLHCEMQAIVRFGGVWLCKDCFNENMREAGAIIRKIKKEWGKCQL